MATLSSDGVKTSRAMQLANVPGLHEDAPDVSRRDRK